jgi:hypothetical protein
MTDATNITELRRRERTNAERQRRYRKRKGHGAVTPGRG